MSLKHKLMLMNSKIFITLQETYKLNYFSMQLETQTENTYNW